MEAVIRTPQRRLSELRCYAVERKILASALLLISSKRESNASEISGLRVARDLDRSSVP